MVLAQDRDYVLVDEPLNNHDRRHDAPVAVMLRGAADELVKTITVMVQDITCGSEYSLVDTAARPGSAVSLRVTSAAQSQARCGAGWRVRPLAGPSAAEVLLGTEDETGRHRQGKADEACVATPRVGSRSVHPLTRAIGMLTGLATQCQRGRRFQGKSKLLLDQAWRSVPCFAFAGQELTKGCTICPNRQSDSTPGWAE